MRKLIDHARTMRRRPTDAEALLWSRLRRKALGVRFRRQHPIGSYIIDFYCAGVRLAIELDGGGHTNEATRRYDDRRTQTLRQLGIRVLRVWNPEVVHNLDAVVELIWRCVRGEDVPMWRGRVELNNTRY